MAYLTSDALVCQDSRTYRSGQFDLPCSGFLFLTCLGTLVRQAKHANTPRLVEVHMHFYKVVKAGTGAGSGRLYHCCALLAWLRRWAWAGACCQQRCQHWPSAAAAAVAAAVTGAAAEAAGMAVGAQAATLLLT